MYLSYEKLILTFSFLELCLTNVIGNDYNNNCELAEQNGCQFYKNKGNSQCVYTGITNLKGGFLFAKSMSETGINKLEVIHNYQDLLIVRKTKTELSKPISNAGTTWRFSMQRTKLLEIVTSMQIHENESLLSTFDMGSTSEIKIVFHGNIAFSFKDPCVLSLAFTSNEMTFTRTKPHMTPPSTNHKQEPTTTTETGTTISSTTDEDEPIYLETVEEPSTQLSNCGQNPPMGEVKKNCLVCVILSIAVQCYLFQRYCGRETPQKLF